MTFKGKSDVWWFWAVIMAKFRGFLKMFSLLLRSLGGSSIISDDLACFRVISFEVVVDLCSAVVEARVDSFV